MTESVSQVWRQNIVMLCKKWELARGPKALPGTEWELAGAGIFTRSMLRPA